METHEKVWRKNPTEKNVFVSRFVHLSYPKLKGVKKVLDVACGNGLGVTLPLLQKGLNVSCFDHHKSAIDAVKLNTKGYKVKTKKADMFKKFPYKDNSFDACFCFQAMYHGRLEQIMHCLSEIKRVTKKGGYFFSTMISYEMLGFDKKKKMYYLEVPLPTGKVINWHKQDETQPHLFYYLSKNFEYMVPHYYFTKEELKTVWGQFFSKVKVKQLRNKNKASKFMYIECKI